MPSLSVLFRDARGAVKRCIDIVNGRLVRDDFKEADHPRAANGQFGSGNASATMHVVTSASSDGVKVHHVGTDYAAAEKVSESLEEQGVGHDLHEVLHFGSTDGGEFHVVHSGDEDSGVTVHATHSDAASAKEHAALLAREAWDGAKLTRDDLPLDRAESAKAAEAWNKGIDDARAEGEKRRADITSEVDEIHGGEMTEERHAELKDRLDEDAEAYPEEHRPRVMLKDGEVQYDRSNRPRFERDGAPVIPTAGQRKDYDEHFGEMFPADQAVAFPGITDSNEHFDSEGQPESVFRVASQEPKPSRRRVNLFAAAGGGGASGSAASGGGLLSKMIGGSAHDAEFKEGEHPRANNGQFGSGTKAHIVTSHDSDTGETTFHHVGTDKKDAAATRDRIEDGDEDEEIDGDGSAEHHAVKVGGRKGEDSADAIHIVHAPDGAGGVDIHGAHLDEGAARGQAHELSKAEWEENGARRSEAGLSELEKVDVAQAWNDEHANDHDDVMVKVDDDGDPILDDDGEFQFTQDGQDVDPGDDVLEAFGAVSEEMYPGDEPAVYPGLEKANEHFTDEGRHEAVFKIHTHRAS